MCCSKLNELESVLFTLERLQWPCMCTCFAEMQSVLPTEDDYTRYMCKALAELNLNALHVQMFR